MALWLVTITILDNYDTSTPKKRADLRCPHISLFLSKALLNYIGGAFIYVKREYAGRIRTLGAFTNFYPTTMVLLMDKILHHLGLLKPYK